MKLRFAIGVIAVLCLAQVCRAGDADVEITSQPKKFGNVEGRKSYSEEVSKTEQWGYTVTLENKTFKSIGNLEVKYLIFYKHQELGSRGEPQEKHASGSFNIEQIPSLEKTSFETNPVSLTKAALVGQDGGYMYFANGGKAKTDDSLVGIWVRVMQNGAVLTEYANPPDLTSREQWE